MPSYGGTQVEKEAGGIDYLDSIPGLHKSFKILAEFLFGLFLIRPSNTGKELKFNKKFNQSGEVLPIL